MSDREEIILTESQYKEIMINIVFNKSGNIGDGSKIIRYIQLLESQIKQLEKENESLKCCGNCGKDRLCMQPSSMGQSGMNCKYWQPKEVKL